MLHPLNLKERKMPMVQKDFLVELEVDVIVVVNVDVDAYDLLNWLLPKNSAENCCVMHPLLF